MRAQKPSCNLTTRVDCLYLCPYLLPVSGKVLQALVSVSSTNWPLKTTQVVCIVPSIARSPNPWMDPINNPCPSTRIQDTESPIERAQYGGIADLNGTYDE